MKLPEPAYLRLSDLQSGVDEYYTAAQMRQYRLDTLEEAAQACEARLETGAHLRCAADIRKLREKT